AHALVEVEGPGGRRWHGLADRHGSAVVMFSYPPFRAGSPSASPPAGAGIQTWPLRLRVRSMPGGLDTIDGADLPDLRSVLEQPQARLRPAVSSAALTDELPVELEIGRELVVRTRGLPHLIVTSAASPP